MNLYARDGRQIDLWEFDRLYGDPNYRVVQAHRTADNVIVRTEWMGNGPGYEGARPLIFRTLVQGGESDGLVSWSATEEQALERHSFYLGLVDHRRLSTRFTLVFFAALVLLVVVGGLATLL